MLIVFEGVDACGKQTQSKRLAQYLNARRIAFPTYALEPDGPTGELIGGHLARRWSCIPACGPDEFKHAGGRLDAHVFQCLQTINRYEMAPTIEGVLREGKSVVLDRYWQSAYAYGAADGLNRAWLERINTCLPQADVNFLLDIDFETSLTRRPDRRDRYEKLGADFYALVRSFYLSLWDLKARAEGSKQKWIVLDGRKSEDEIFSTALKELSL